MEPDAIHGKGIAAALLVVSAPTVLAVNAKLVMAPWSTKTSGELLVVKLVPTALMVTTDAEAKVTAVANIILT